MHLPNPCSLSSSRLYRKSSAREAAMCSFKALLSGSQPLSKAMGGYLILGGLLALTASSVIGLIVITAFPAARIGVYVAGFAVFWAYVFLASIGTWRSANQTKGRLTIVAKAVVVLLATLFLLIFLGRTESSPL
jgi:hypothetical protein